MDKSHISLLLGTAATYDRRTIGDADVHAWHAAIGDLPFDDARQAVIDHYGTSTEWLKPGHVRAGVKRLRAERLANSDLALPVADPNARDYTRQLRAQIKAIADGAHVDLALTPGQRHASGPNAAYIAARGRDYTRRRAALSVACPHPGCAAEAGRPCPAPADPFHPARLEAALRLLANPPAEDTPTPEPAAPAAAVSSTPWCGRCHAETRTKTILLDSHTLARTPCPVCGPPQEPPP